MSESVPPPSEANGQHTGTADGLLRFSCGHCGMVLTAPTSVAGVVAPCPTCGKSVQAPNLPPEPGPKPIAPKPRQLPGDSAPAVPVAAPQAPVAQESPVNPGSAPGSGFAPAGGNLPQPDQRRKRRVKGSINPSTVLSANYENRKEVGAIVRVILAILLTLALTVGVFYFVRMKISEPRSEPPVSRPGTR